MLDFNNPLDVDFVLSEIHRFHLSPKKKAMLDGNRYYLGRHDITSRKRFVIGEDGNQQELAHLPNNIIINNQYKKMVDQKNNYLLGHPLSIASDNNRYANLLNHIMNKKFLRLLKNIGEDSLNCGIGWLFTHYDSFGTLSFKRFHPFEVIPGWRDAEHSVLDYAIRVYHAPSYPQSSPCSPPDLIQFVEVYQSNGISYFQLLHDSLVPIHPFHQNYFSISHDSSSPIPYNWNSIPLIPFKYNAKEIPLINMLKSLQDALNLILSNFQNQMEEDPRNSILVLVNYDGQNLAEFRKNLATYGAVKVRSSDGSHGDVKSLQVEVNSTNYKTIISIFKKAIIENAMGYDASDNRLSGNPNQMNIRSMYSDVDLDANSMETEFQASFQDLISLLDAHLFNAQLGDFFLEDSNIIFNRDILINESEVISNCIKSIDILSDKTIVAHHPWVSDPHAELHKLHAQSNPSQAPNSPQS